ncbi:hypothetical protein I4U23_027217 [Adineta vaga]|nr:hypothetical protein I4U23_027217 [Adineta vaga]
MYTVLVCGASPCYQSYGIYGLREFIGSSRLPILLEGIFSVTLVIRIYQQKQRLRQSNRWSKQRRMIIQLNLVSGFDVILNTPNFFIPLLRRFGFSPSFGIEPELYFFYLGHFVVFLFPFASLCQHLDLRKIIKQKLFIIYQHSHRTAVVVPAITVLPGKIHE